MIVLCARGACADRLGITEVVTDPQSDHSESTGGNGVVFDHVSGSGSVTSSDEFVELYWAGREAVDLTGYRIDFLDTTPSSYVFGKSTAGTLRFSSGSKLTALMPMGVVLLGNPPGALNNKIRIELYTPAGVLSDHWDLTAPGFDGNATGLEDEAVARQIPGSPLFHTSITPLWVEEWQPVFPAGGVLPDGADTTSVPQQSTPTPEPSTFVLCVLSAAGVLFSKWRRARRALRRTHS